MKGRLACQRAGLSTRGSHGVGRRAAGGGRRRLRRLEPAGTRDGARHIRCPIRLRMLSVVGEPRGERRVRWVSAPAACGAKELADILFLATTATRDWCSMERL